MAKRYVLNPVIGAGTENNPYRAAVSGVSQTNHNSLIPTHPIGHAEEGQPKFNFAFSVVGTANLAGVSAISNAFVFPDYPLDGRLDGMEGATRTGMVQSTEAYDLDGADFHLNLDGFGDASSYRDLVLGILQQMDPNYPSHLNGFDVQEPGQ